MIQSSEYGASKSMSADAKIEKYAAIKLGLLPVAGLTIRQTLPQTGESRQSLTVELLKGEQTVSLTFSGLRQLCLADLHPGSLCFLKISSVAQDQMEGVRYRVCNAEQDFTLSFYCADFKFSA
jgi:hypothetical protein